jgi:hypothetical protein
LPTSMNATRDTPTGSNCRTDADWKAGENLGQALRTHCIRKRETAFRMTNLPSRLLIVDDSIPVRRAIVSLIAQNSPEWLVCGEAADAEEGARLCRSLAPRWPLGRKTSSAGARCNQDRL